MGQARDEAGNIWETDAQGNAVRLVSAAGQSGGVLTLPPDATQQANIDNAARDDARADAMMPLRQQLIQAQIRSANAAASKSEQGTAGANAGDAKQQQRIANLNSLVEQINRVQELYESGPGATHGIMGFGDFLPTPGNRRFDAAAAGLSEQGLAAFRVPGVGAQSDTELRQFVQANRPEASDYDETIEEKLSQLRNRVDSTRQEMGLAPAEWRPSAMNALRMGNSTGPEAAPYGATTGTNSEDLPPPEYVAEHDAMLAQLIQQGGGRVDPQAYGQAARAIGAKYNYDPADPEGWAAGLNDYLDRGGRTIPSGVAVQERQLSQDEQNRNNLVSNPLGAFAAGVADTGSFGGLAALAPEQLGALSDANPGSMAAGQVIGAIGGTAGLGKIGAETIGRVAPRTLAGGKGAQFLRNMGTDAAYGGIYGGATGQDPLASAGLSMIGSAGGQGVGKLLGRAVSGVTSSPTVSRLYEQGIIPTLGQIMRGRAADNGGRSIVAGLEDTMANNAALGTFVNNARNRALEQANLAAFNVGAKGQGQITDIGERGLNQLDLVKDAAYDRALQGVSLPVDDPAFKQSLDAAGVSGRAADAARNRGDFSFVIDNQLAPAIGGGPNISGEQLQDALRLLQGQSRAYSRAATGATPDPAAAHVADAFDLVGDALTDLAGNYSPDTLPQLQDANAIYRSLRVLDDAAYRGRNEGGTFTGAQLGDAVGANNRQFGGRGFSAQTRSPFFQLQQDMQAVLPNKVPPTGVNLAPALAMAGAASGAGGYATDNDALKWASLLALAAAPYTKGGQRVAAGALLGGGPRRQMIGGAIRRNAGLLGSATLPFLITE